MQAHRTERRLPNTVASVSREIFPCVIPQSGTRTQDASSHRGTATAPPRTKYYSRLALFQVLIFAFMQRDALVLDENSTVVDLSGKGVTDAAPIVRCKSLLSLSLRGNDLLQVGEGASTAQGCGLLTCAAVAATT